MLVDKKDIMLEAGVEVWLQAKVDNHRVVVTVYMGVYAVHPFEYLANET